MGRAPCCDKSKVKKGPWSPEEDATLKNYIEKHGTGGNWIALPHKVGLKRCGKSCRLRWLNYLRPNIKHGEFSEDEDTIICTLFATIGSRWSIIAGQLPGRTDNDIKNYWNTKLKKKLIASVAPPPPNNYHHHQKKHHNQIITNFSSPPSNNSSLLIGSSYSSPSLFNCTQLPVYNRNDAVFASNADGLVGHVQGNYYLNYNQNISGGPSCSSSDGSCITNNQISCRNGKGLVEPDYNRFLQSLLSNNGVLSDDNKFMISSSNYINDGCFVGGDQNPVDHSIEEIKQLISSTNTNISSSNSLNFFVDEIKTEDKLLFDY
ncbi:hypothetical protein ACP275_12G145500 [Erythranthe tilingii]